MDKQVVSRSLNDINTCFAKILLDSNFYSSNETISWRNYEPGIDKGIAYAAVYQRLIDKRQYSFLLQDNSFFQLYFEWNDETISKAKLAFYPAPIKISGALESLLESAELSGVDLIEELYFGAETWVSRGIDIVNTSYIRLDFDTEVETHAKCHIQIASINELRITSKYLLNPFNFFNWICAHLRLQEYNTAMGTASYYHAFNYHKIRNYEAQQVNDTFPFLSSMNL